MAEKDRTEHNGDVTGLQAARLVRGVRGFVADMREQGVHVGLGSPPICATCDESWPCPTSKIGHLL